MENKFTEKMYKDAEFLYALQQNPYWTEKLKPLISEIAELNYQYNILKKGEQITVNTGFSEITIKVNK